MKKIYLLLAIFLPAYVYGYENNPIDDGLTKFKIDIVGGNYKRISLVEEGKAYEKLISYETGVGIAFREINGETVLSKNILYELLCIIGYLLTSEVWFDTPYEYIWIIPQAIGNSKLHFYFPKIKYADAFVGISTDFFDEASLQGVIGIEYFTKSLGFSLEYCRQFNPKITDEIYNPVIGINIILSFENDLFKQ